MRRAWRATLAFAVVLQAPAVAAQGYRLRVDSRIQGVAWRGVERDSIPPDAAVPGPNGGLATPDGYALACDDRWCHYLRAGPEVRGVPVVNQVDLTAWGFGVAGLSLRANARHASDLEDDTRWPGTEPSLQLVEGYLEYQRGALRAQAGRLFLPSRLGAYGLDGGRLDWRAHGLGLDLAAYGGWGLARGTVLPVTSPAVNPLDDFQPRDRQVAVGAELGWSATGVEARLEYRREVDPAVHYFVSERAAASLAVRPLAGFSVQAGGAYDLAMGHWGSADASASWFGRIATVTIGARRYLPFFDLWTIWGAFAPAAFHAWHGALTVTPRRDLTLFARGERYRFEETGTRTALVDVEDRGWRVETGATWQPTAAWHLRLGHEAEFGPGAAALGYDARLTWRPHDALTVAAHGATLRRPLELRWSDASLAVYGGDLEWRPGSQWRLGVGITRVDERRDRPDAAAIDWDQWRLNARVTLLMGTDADRLPLPPAVRTGAPR